MPVQKLMPNRFISFVACIEIFIYKAPLKLLSIPACVPITIQCSVKPNFKDLKDLQNVEHRLNFS